MLTFPAVLTSSLDLDPCNYRWFIQRVFNLRKEKTYQRDLDFGSAFAEAIFEARKAYFQDKLSAREAMDKSYSVVDEKFFPEFQSAMAKRASSGGKEEKIKTPDRLIGLLDKYWERFPIGKEPFVPYMVKDGKFSAEQSLVYDLDLTIQGNALQLAIKPDLIALGKLGTTLIDEKTITKSYIESGVQISLYKMRPQFLLYSKVLRELIKKGTLDMPPLQAFEVRRAVITREISATNDEVTRTSWACDEAAENSFFESFIELISHRMQLFFAIEDAELYQISDRLFLERNHHQCYAYGRPCPLLEHCAEGRLLMQMGFKVSSIDPNTKEVTFEDEQ